MENENPTAEYDDILGGKFTSPDIDESEDDADADDEVRTTWKPELKKVVQMTDEDGKHHLLGFENYKPTRPSRAQQKQDAPKKEPFRDSAMLLKAVVSRNGYWGSTIDLQLEIQSERLLKLFRKHARRHRELSLDSSPLVIEYPFRCLFFLRSTFQSIYEDQKTPSDTKKELLPLLHFIEEPLGVQKHIEVYDELVLKQHQITFRMMWSIFPPYTPVVVADPDEPDAAGAGYLLESIDLSHDREGHTKWELALLHGHHSGESFQVRKTTRSIKYFNGKKDISLRQLPILPLHLLEEGQRNAIRDRLIARGKKYVQYCKADTSFLHYTGPVNLQTEDTSSRLGAWGSTGALEISERVVLDRRAQGEVDGYSDRDGSYRADSLGEYFSSGTDDDKPPTHISSATFGHVTLADLAKIGQSKGISVDHEQVKEKDITLDPVAFAKKRKVKLTDEDYFICQSTTVGFALDQKAWVYNIRISRLKEIEWNGDPFKMLQFTPEAKRLVERLVKGFSNRAEDVYDDIIQDKGKGLIFLLHGPPGLGKTLTAESVAESARRPLYRVTTGALSTDVDQLEKQLSDIFRLGARWRAVVLLDEADVLMSKRTTTDLTRNAIVAVFLRLLEYYKGMLFLTTNRHDDFDEAFHSRIHLTLEYGALTPEWRRNIWMEHIGRASARNRNKNLWREEMFEVLAEIDTNGRDIKNYARTAYAFAQAETEDLSLQHLMIVLVNNLPEVRRKKHEGTFAKLRDMERVLSKEMEALKDVENGTEEARE
ncbi:P-loop containing nucleoside triphosphate hydrolase protein [Cercophora newfieldiana]|uniref:P-loop containing nucleoside triphosphate hydrolase protein n=1 Tax=Cercophora newfieldiana TaxID=92897 RepID=A0AA39XZP5_9PEZI|nr:P-loop containing nucleoside triphosphate hydrolase protein [Cercophora newfieldiana]